MQRLAGDQRQVDLTFAETFEQRLGPLLVHGEGEVRKVLPQARVDVRQQVGRDGRDHAEAERAVRVAALAGDEVGELLAPFDDRPRPADELAAEWGELHAPPQPVEQAAAAAVLQLPDLLAQGRLGHVAAFGGTPEVARLGERNRVLHLSKGNSHKRSLSCPEDQSIGLMVSESR